MKTLVVVRHAKSSWDNLGQADFDRPLNDRGKRDAPEMAKRLLNRKIQVDKFVSSPAKRAKKTAIAFAEAFGKKEEQITFIDKLYHAPATVFFEVLEEFDTSKDTVAIFAHNPGITDFVNDLVEDVDLDNMPTCGVFVVDADVQTWAAFPAAKKRLVYFDYPKNV